MAKKLLFLLPLLIGAPLFLTGALSRPDAAPSPAPAEPAFVPQQMTLAPTIAGKDAAAILAQAVERLTPQRVPWLRCQLWQRMNDAEVAFESDGTLQLGPRQCARLDLAVHCGGKTGRLLVVSDGHVLAQVTQFAKDEPVVESLALTPETAGRSAADVLRAKGCGGPFVLLRELREKLNPLTMQTGRWKEQPSIRLEGRLPSGKGPTTAIPAERCLLTLDARTLWPARVEWWGTDRKQEPRALLMLEFRQPVLNHELTLAECIREFSYKPGKAE